tara:strand:- start:736 stop:1002 length:267 start_codon:yes stop_codon:yes gene_type:complete
MINKNEILDAAYEVQRALLILDRDGIKVFSTSEAKSGRDLLNNMDKVIDHLEKQLSVPDFTTIGEIFDQEEKKILEEYRASLKLGGTI